MGMYRPHAQHKNSITLLGNGLPSCHVSRIGVPDLGRLGSLNPPVWASCVRSYDVAGPTTPWATSLEASPSVEGPTGAKESAISRGHCSYYGPRPRGARTLWPVRFSSSSHHKANKTPIWEIQQGRHPSTTSIRGSASGRGGSSRRQGSSGQHTGDGRCTRGSGRQHGNGRKSFCQQRWQKREC